jgi:hypothetical protein
MAQDIQGGKTGQNTGDAYFLVKTLDGIRHEFTGKTIARSDKRRDTSRDYIATVFKIADPEIGAGTIDKAMKNAITTRRRRILDGRPGFVRGESDTVD